MTNYPKKALVIASFFPPYGGEFCIDQAQLLQKQGYQVDIIANVMISLSLSKMEYFSLPFGTNVETNNDIRTYKYYQRRIPKSIKVNMERWTQNTLRMVNSYIKENGAPHIIHAQCCKWAGYVALLMKKKLSIPYVITEHIAVMVFEDEFNMTTGEKWQIKLLKEAYKEAEMVVLVSPDWSKKASKLFGTDYRSMFISNVIDTSFFIPEPLQQLPAEFTFICPALFDYRKGFDILLPAFDKLCAQYPNLRLVIVGRGFDQLQFKNLYQSTKFKNNITLLSEQPRATIRDLIGRAHALVLASREENQPLVVLEAMLMEKPIVVTDTVPYIVRNIEGCYTSSINSISSLTKQMAQLILEYDLINKKAIREHALKIADPTVVGAQLKQLFDSIIRK